MIKNLIILILTISCYVMYSEINRLEITLHKYRDYVAYLIQEKEKINTPVIERKNAFSYIYDFCSTNSDLIIAGCLILIFGGIIYLNIQGNTANETLKSIENNNILNNDINTLSNNIEKSHTILEEKLLDISGKMDYQIVSMKPLKQNLLNIYSLKPKTYSLILNYSETDPNVAAYIANNEAAYNLLNQYLNSFS